MANSNGWGDGASNNTIGWGQGANNTIGWGDSHAKSWAGLTDIAGFDSSAISFFNATGITNTTQQDAIDNLVRGLKDDGIWNKMKAIYPFVGGTATTHKFNLKDPRDVDAAFRLVFNGGWTHSSTGALPNGTNGYADTKLLGNTDVIKGNFGFGIYSRTNTLTSGAYGVDSSLHIYPRFTDTNSYYRIFNNSTAVINGTSLGFFSGFNDSTNTSYAWFNAVKKQTLASPLTITSANLMLSGNVASTGGYDNRQLAFAFASQYLNDTEVTNLYTRVQAFQTALSRQV